MRPLLTLFVVAATCAGAASAQEYPKLKAGQWDMTIVSAKGNTNAAPVKSTMCTDDALQRDMIAMGAGMSREMCTKSEFKRDGARYIVVAECKLGESKFVSRSVMTVSGDTSYHTEISASYDPPFMGMKESQTTLDGKYAGPCRDGLVPGDFIGPGGQKFNMKNIAASRTLPLPSTAPTQPSAPAKATK